MRRKQRRERDGKTRMKEEGKVGQKGKDSGREGSRTGKGREGENKKRWLLLWSASFPALLG